MIAWWWSWLLAVASLGCTWVVGNRRWWGWALAAGLQLLWIPYAVVTGQLGFVASALGFGAVNIRNMIKWKRKQGWEQPTDEHARASLGHACPSTPRCEHPAWVHDIDTYENPHPVCCVDGCGCGQVSQAERAGA